MFDNQITTALEVPYATPHLGSRTEKLTRASAHLWWVQDRPGHVLGHLRLLVDPLGLRYRADRLHLATGEFRLVGDFWRAEDAVAALRNG